MINNHCYCVIMAGGSGSRFWPISRESNPKQFLDFSETGVSFLRKTFDRFSAVIPTENIIVVSLTKYRGLVMQHLPDLQDQNLLLEPYSRNTAPCLAFATYAILKRDPDAVIIATPSDHIISDETKFAGTIAAAMDYASRTDAIITLGIVPDRPDPNFGYIQASGEQGSYKERKPLKVKTFTEKPDRALADVFIRSGEFLWNSGIFVCRAEVMRTEMEKLIPEVTSLFRGWENCLGTPMEKTFLEKAYMNMERQSIDYGVMEKTDKAWTYPADFGWADIGNWESLYGYLAVRDLDGNAVKTASSILQDNRDSIIYSKSADKLVVVKGLDNFIVVDTPDALLICPRDDRKLKEIIAHVALPEYEKYR